MGFFKSIGNKLKRVVSINTLTKVATGNFSAVGKEVLRVATTDKIKDPKTGKMIVVPSGTKIEIPEFVDNVLKVEGDKFAKIAASAVAENKTVQDAVDFLSKAAIKAWWLKHRNWIIGLLVSLLLFFAVKSAFFGKMNKRARR